MSRGNVRFDVPDFVARETGARRVLALSEYFVESLRLRIEALAVTRRTRIGRSSLTLALEYAEALKRAGNLKLRALDLLHLVYAELISSLRVRVERFVTSDEGILDRSRAIEEQLGFRAVHPTEAAQ